MNNAELWEKVARIRQRHFALSGSLAELLIVVEELLRDGEKKEREMISRAQRALDNEPLA